jgi:hypothetical protein
MYTATSIDGAAARYASTVTLDSAAGALVEGDRIYIAGDAGNEIHTVKGHDTSTVATWTVGLNVSLLWTPTGGGQAFTEMAQVGRRTLAIEGLEERFRAVYPRAYADFLEPEKKFSLMREESERQLKAELLSNGLNMDRIVDQDTIAPVLMARMAYLWTLNGDVNKEDERKALGSEYNKLVAQLIRDPIWQDSDEDLVEDDTENTSHMWQFERGW